MALHLRLGFRREIPLCVKLADCLPQCSIRCGDRKLLAIRRLLCSRQNRAIEREMFAGDGLGQDCGIMFDQMKSEIVLPHVDAFRFHQSGYASHCRRLPDREIMLSGKSGGFEIGFPVHARRLDAEIAALPGVVLLEYIGGIGIWSESLCDSALERQDACGPGRRVCNSRQCQHCRDVRLVLRAQRDHLRRGVEIVVAIGHPQTTLPQVDNIVLSVFEALVDPQTKNVVSICGEPINLARQGSAKIG